MQTVLVRGGWRAWALLVGGGALLIVLGLVVSLFLLGALVVGGVLLLGYRVMRAFGPPKSPAPTESVPGSSDGVIDGEFVVVTRRTTPGELAEPAE